MTSVGKLAHCAFLAALTICLASCGILGIRPAPESHNARTFALDAVHDLENDREVALLARLQPPLNVQLNQRIGAMRAQLPQGSALREQVVFSYSTEISYAAGSHHFDRYTIEVSDGNSWSFVRCEVRDGDATPMIDAFYIQKMPMSYREWTEFSFNNASAIGIFTLMAAVAALCTTIYGWVTLWHSSAFVRKWPWAIAIAISVCQFHARWIDGAWSFQPISFVAGGLGAMRMNDEPWIITAGFPLFALWVIMKDRRDRAQRSEIYD